MWALPESRKGAHLSLGTGGWLSAGPHPGHSLGVTYTGGAGGTPCAVGKSQRLWRAVASQTPRSKYIWAP